MAVRCARPPWIGLVAYASLLVVALSAAPAGASATFSNSLYRARAAGPTDGTGYGSRSAVTDTGHPAGTGRAITSFESGGSVRFTQVLFAVSPGEPPPAAETPEPVAEVAEPRTLVLLGTALAGLFVLGRLRQRG